MMLRKIRDSERGVSLLEIVIVLALLGLAATGLTAALATGLRVGVVLDDQTTSINLVTNQLEDILTQTYVEPPDYSTTTIPEGFSIAFDNEVIKPTLLSRITVIVSNAVEELFGITTHKVNEQFVASPPSLLLAQRDFRWYQNVDSTTTTVPLAEENTAYTLATAGQVVRLRMSVEVFRLPLAAGEESFKLQYSTSPDGPWSDVGNIASSTPVFKGFNNPISADGITLQSVVLTDSDVPQSYEEENPSVSVPNPVAVDEQAEWDWVIQENGAEFNTNYLFRMVRSDGTPLESYTRFVVLTSPSPVTLSQSDYRWYSNADSLTPGSSLGGLNTSIAATTHGETYRLRMNIEVDGAALVAGSQLFKLQYSTSTSGVWEDVGAPGSGSTWRGAVNPSVPDGSTTTAILVTSDLGATYEDSNPTAATPTDVQAGEKVEWDWVVQDNGAADRTEYRFRMVLDDGSALDSYVLIAVLTTPATTIYTQQDYRWYENVDSVTTTVSLAGVNQPFTSAEQSGTYRLRMNVELGAAAIAAGVQAFKLQYATSTSGTWTDIGAIGSGEIWRGVDNPTPSDGDSLFSVAIATSTVAQSYEEGNPSVENVRSIGTGDFAEWDWVVQNNGATPVTTYFFRMVRGDGTALDTYTPSYPEVTTAVGGLVQQDYQWYVNRNNEDPVIALAATNTAIVGVTSTNVVRLRLTLAATGADLEVASQAFKLQFATSTGGTWTDVGGIGSDELWRGFDNGLVADGDPISPLISGSNIGQSYEEENPSVSNPAGLLVGGVGEWDWVVQNFGAPADDWFFRMVESDGTPVGGYTNYPQLTAVEPTLDQENYQWRQNADSATPGAALAAENTSTTGAAPGDLFRLRVNVEVSDEPMPAQGQKFKLQFSSNTTTGPWTDVGDIGSNEIWRGFDNGSVTDGATLPSLILTTSTIRATYEEENASAVNPFEASTGDFVEWDWVIENRLAPTGSYFFRMVKRDGRPFDSYTSYPAITASGPAQVQEDYRWFTNIDNATPTPALAGVNTPFVATEETPTYRLRMNLEVQDSTLLAGAQAFKLQYSTSQSGPWSDVGSITSTSEDWRGFDNPSVADGIDVVTLIASSTVAGTYEEENPTVANPNQGSINDRIEWDWVLSPAGATPVETYYFRMVLASGGELKSYTRFPTITTPQTAVVAQQDYRWYDNVATTTPTTSLASENTRHTGAVPGDVFRLRLNLGVTDSDVGAGSRQFKVQYAATSSDPVLPWQDVGGLAPDDIELDATSSNSASGGSATLTISHTVGSQNNRLLVVGATGEDSSATDCTVTGVTYGGVPLTKVDEEVAGTTFLCTSLWYLTAPSAGTADIVVTWNGDVSRRNGGGISIYNALQEAPEAQNSQGSDSATSILTTLSSVSEGSWVIDAVGSGTGSGITVTEAGQTERYNVDAGTSRGAGSTKLAAATGPTSVGWSQSSEAIAHVVAAFRPFSETQTFDRIWRAFDNDDVDDGTTLPATLLTSSTVGESYEEANPSAVNPNAIADGDLAEWDWVIENNGAPTGDFIFRVVNEDGIALSNYANYPELETASPSFTQQDWRWYANVDDVDNDLEWRTFSDAPTGVGFGGSLTTDGVDLYAFRGGTSADFRKYDVSVNGWVSLADAPGTVGAVEYANGFIYAFQGADSSALWRYNTSTNTWSTMTSAPALVEWGGALAWDGADTVYAFQGNNSTAFWSYSISGDSWSTLTSTPAIVHRGGSLVHVSGDVYAMRGDATTEFWRLSVSGGAWSVITSTPATVRSGGSLDWDDGSFLYALRGDFNTDYWRYNLGSQSWDVLTTTPAGVEDGGALAVLDGVIYGLRGDNTTDFWAYGTAPTTPLTDENTAFVADTNGLVYRIRMNVEIGTVDMPTSTERFILQFATGTPSVWADVGGIGSSLPWRGFDNVSVDGGTSIGTLLSSSTVGQSYDEENPSTLNPTPASAGDFAEWDWVVQPNTIEPNTTYFFRMVRDEGTPFGSYGTYPEITTPEATAMTQRDYRWYDTRTNITPNSPHQPENTPHTGVSPLDVLRLRMNVSLDDGTLAAGTQAFKLQFSTSTSGGWQDVGGTGSTAIWRGFDEGGATTIDGDTIPSLVLASSTVAATYEDSNPSASTPSSIPVGDIAEWDWVLQSNSAPTATYFFRMVLSNGTALTSYTTSTYPELSDLPPKN